MSRKQEDPDAKHAAEETNPASFRFKPFAEMTEADYRAVGFRCGLEIHQQLLTGKKLFCRCPAGRYDDAFHAEILRHMRPTLSELGEYDGTALMEFKTRKEILYHINHETVCTYEMDDTPPFELNEEALDRALVIGMLYGCSMVDEIHITRKQYLDGSIPTGFQRTTIVGVEGRIPYQDRHIRVIQLGLEEDACREVSDVGHRRTFLTDRLGMPLIETVTAPEMRTPREAAEVGEIFRRLVRSTGLVRTGIGAGRQDVNVSVRGGTRIEIKGVPRIPAIPLLTYNEAMRQWNLLSLRDELKRRGITEETFEAGTEDVTKILKRTRYEPLRRAIAEGGVARCVKLCGFRDLLRWPTQTDTFFAREIMDRVRVVACLTTLPNIVHSDSPSETISTTRWASLRKALEAGEGDTLVVVWGPAEDADTGAGEITLRSLEATRGVPSETRQAHSDGTNGFERILPGPDRMYPDTDLPPKRIPMDRLDRLRAAVPAPIWEREAWYREMGLPPDVVRELAVSPHAERFAVLVREAGVSPMAAAEVMSRYRTRLRRAGLADVEKEADAFEGLLRAHGRGEIAREGLWEVLRRAMKAGRWDENLLPDRKGAPESRKCAASALAGMPARKGFSGDKRFRAVMGEAMEGIRGAVPGADVAGAVRTMLGEEGP